MDPFHFQPDTSWPVLDSVHARIRNGELNISEDYFLTCLYPKGYGNADDVEKYFLRSSLLVKVGFFVSFLFSIANNRLPRHFVLSLPLHRLLKHLKNTNLMMDQLGRCRRQLHKRRQRRVLWQVFSTWKARLLPGLSHTRWHWYGLQFLWSCYDW